MTNKKGFTLIELLVVIVIIGLLATMALIALNSARAKGRDAKRVADIKQMQTALELYYNDQHNYPSGTDLVIGEGTSCNSAACDNLCTKDVGTSGNDGFINGACGADSASLMAVAPADPDPGVADCGTTGDDNGFYVYNQINSGEAGDYNITFCLEGTVNDMSGKCTASQAGLLCGAA